MSAAPSPAAEPDDRDPRLEPHASRLMREQTRETWLVPLLAVPLSRLGLSPFCTDDDIQRLTGHCPQRVREEAQRVNSLVRTVAESSTEHILQPEDALLLVEHSHDLRGLAGAFLHPAPILHQALGLPDDLPGGPLIRGVAEWLAASEIPTPLAALVAGHVLFPAMHDLQDYVPRAHARFAAVTRAIGHRMADDHVTNWEGALRMADGFWDGQGWSDLGVWQHHAMRQMIESLGSQADPDDDLANRMHAKTVRLHRAERKRLQAAAAEAHNELRKLRPLRRDVSRLREEVQRVHVREAELVQARDRAHARVAALEATILELERHGKEVRRRLAALTPQPAATPVEAATERQALPSEQPLPATLLRGRDVFFFTGQIRKAAAELAGESLRVLGPREIRKFCVHKGSLGPESFPPGALVVLDVRFIAHKHSIIIEDRARRSAVEYLPVRSGMGGLARAVADAVARHRAGSS